MACLLDTHTLIWYVELYHALSPKAREAIEDPAVPIFVSLISFWEITIKIATGKLVLKRPVEVIEEEVREQGILIMPLRFSHVLPIQTLPFYHRDPFDRLLIAQAMTENLTLVSRDPKFAPYPINTLW
jgi:PIN domain nuclease of toxin-antitoxin system